MAGTIIKNRILLLLFIFLSVSLSGCKGSEKLPDQSITYSLQSGPRIIDPALSTSCDEADVILACFEGLMRLDKDNKAIPGIAASYEKSSSSKYLFKLRDAKWSDGKTVSAKDFEYAWKRVLSPETGCEYAYQLYIIKGGEAYNKGECGTDEVGVKAIDDRTLEVTLEEPLPYFPMLLAQPIFMPVRQDIIKANPGTWASKPSTYIGNGPFELASWETNDSIEFIKNPDYYDADRVKLDKLTFTTIPDSNECIEAFENGGIDMIESPTPDEISVLKNSSVLTVTPCTGVYYYSFNLNVKPLNDKNVRKALSYAIDRSVLIQNIIGNEAIPAVAFVPNGIPDASYINKDFRETGGAYLNPEGQVEEAQKLLEDAGYPGGRGFPKLTLIYNDLGYHGEIARAVQEMWKNNLGINIDIKGENWKGLLESRNSGNFDIIRNGWISDYADPMIFLDLFVSSSSNNITGYKNNALDDLISSARYEDDYAKRSAMMHQAEDIVMDDMPVLPVYFYSDPLCSKAYVKDVIKLPLGYTYFDEAHVEAGGGNQ